MKYVGRVASECLLPGCPVLVKIKILFVMRVFKILKVGENLNFHLFKYLKKKKSIDIDTLHIRTTWVVLSRCFGVFFFKDSWIHHRKQRSHNLLPDNLPKKTLGVTFLNTLKINEF